MTRSNARELAVHFVFELGFSGQSADELLAESLTRTVFERIGQEEPLYSQFPNVEQRAYITALVRGVFDHTYELDDAISRYAIGWKLSRLPRIVVAILKVCMYEILYMQDVPNAAAINEAVELTKKYEEEELAGFVNGILGSFVRAEGSGETLPQAEVVLAPDAFDEADVTEAAEAVAGDAGE